MAELHRCATCGSVLSETLSGQCPLCLLKGGLHAFAPAAASVTCANGPAETGPARTAVLPSPGKQFGSYHIVRALGQGGMGSVFEAEEQDTGRRLALKVLNHSLDSPGDRQRFLREGTLAASVNHPHSVYVFGTEEIQGAPVITMELVQGGTLQERVRRHGPMPIQDAADAILQVVDGLQAAEAVGVLHRDVKPANCFVDTDGRVKVGDFGLSISKVGRGDLQLTSKGVFLGTPAFASPEQLRGDELDARSDQYAVGVTLYFLLTGTVPFEAATMVQLVAKVLEKPAPDVRSLRPDVARELAAVLQRCLAKQPNRRYRSYADLRAALLPFSSLLPIAASPFRRFAADCMDKGVNFAFNGVLILVLGLFGYHVAFGSQGAWTLNPVLWLVGLVIYVLYFILPEGLAGATLGKKLLGLRVVRDGTRQPPGILRAGVRSLLFQYLPVVPFVLFMLANPETLGEEGFSNLTGSKFEWLMIASFGFYAVLGLLFVTMRRSNGYAGVHDLVSNCRVVVRPIATHRPSLQEPAEGVDKPQASAATVGPYHVLRYLGKSAAGEWRLGYDPRLFRKVWLCVVPTDTPRLTTARQSVARPGRLRWLAGRRGPQENWDAFEAPAGQSLWQLLERPHDWSHVRYWLLDLAEELAAALKDGTLPETLGLHHVWITAVGRAVLLDQELPDPHPQSLGATTREDGSAASSIVTPPRDVEPANCFLHQVAVAALHGRRVSAAEAHADRFAVPLPLYVRPIVEGLEKVQRPEVAAAQIQAVLTKPTRVTRTRRAGLLACCLGIPLLLIFPFFVQIAMMRANKDVTTDLVDLHNALHWHSPVFEVLKPPEVETKALEIYLAGSQRERINDRATWTNPYMAGVLPQQQIAAKEIVARTPPPTEEELQQALDIIGPRLESRRTDIDAVKIEVMLPIVFAACVWIYVAFPSLICALVFRGGLLWWTFGIAAVKRNGKLAGRWRVCWRNLIAWSPLYIAPFALAILAPLVEPAVPAVFLALAYAAAAAASTFANERSWPDRLAGTWLVIR